MSIFSSRTTKTIPVPFDPPHEVTIRKLAGRHLEKARQVRQLDAVAQFKRVGGAAFQRELQAVRMESTSTEEKPRASVADPLDPFDPYVLLTYGIASWTYPESLTPEVVIDEESEIAADALAKVVAFVEKNGGIQPGLIDDAVSAELKLVKTGRRVIRAIEDMDGDAVEFFAREVLKLTKPSLFQTVEEQEVEQKNG